MADSTTKNSTSCTKKKEISSMMKLFRFSFMKQTQIKTISLISMRSLSFLFGKWKSLRSK